MCGINGIVNLSGQNRDLSTLVESMNRDLRVRGPDGFGAFVDDSNSFAFGHTRLSIVDADNHDADQPMQTADGRYTITFNGEIFNYQELRLQLESLGVTFRTQCDTEVLLEGYARFGQEILEKINGQFAFAIYDTKTKSTFLARDPTGIKPLYYSKSDFRNDSRTGTEFIFASTPHTVSSVVSSFRPNLDAICSQYLSGATFAAGEESQNRSIFSGIDQLMPGHCITVSSDGKLSDRQYYALPIHDVIVKTGDEAGFEKKEYAQKLRLALTQSIVEKIPEEVGFGMMLSGGLDSSIITAVVAHEYKKKGKELVVATIRHAVPGKAQLTSDEELRYATDYHHAKRLVTHLNEQGCTVRMIDYEITPDTFLDNLEEMVAGLGIHDSIRQLGMFENYKQLSQQTSDGKEIKVVMSGEGADEFNHGYWKNFPGLAQDQKTGTCSTTQGFNQMLLQRADFVQSLFAQPVDVGAAAEYMTSLYSSFDTLDPARRMMGIYAFEFLGFLNKSNDRCAMANGIENRVPFQDTRVIDICTQIPREYQTDDISVACGGIEKAVLKDAFSDYLSGTGILERAKAPLPAAAHIAYHEKVLEEYQRRLDIVDSSFWNYFNRETFVNIGRSFEARIAELGQSYDLLDPDQAIKAGQHLTAWRDISVIDFDVVGHQSDDKYVAGRDIRTNDVFKLLTTMVWYQQNCVGSEVRK